LDDFLALVTVTTIVDAMLMGAVLDYSIKQLPARKKIGIVNYRRYFVASDLGNGRFWYIPLGLTAYALNVAVALAGYYLYGLVLSTALFFTAGACALIHAFGTSQAVPAGLRFLKMKEYDEVEKSLDKFALWVLFRGIFGVPMFIGILLGLILVA
jgi:hypothetical protein